MSARQQVLLSWSSGKDSATALAALRADPAVELRGLFTSLNAETGRVAVHDVRRGLLRAQAAAAGLPLFEVELPSPCPNFEYLARVRDALEPLMEDGVEAMAFGDLHLSDVRRFREDQCTELGLGHRFPLWGRETRALAEEMIASGLQATLTCVDPKVLDPSFAGRPFDAALLDALPEGADPCGENGEFHTFVHACTAFRAPIEVVRGERVERGGFVFCDVIPRDGADQ
ncbi:MAG: ATP-binding protein [Planctomycetota bacterium]